MNYEYILRYARAVMDDHGIIIPRRREMMHYIRCVDFFAQCLRQNLTDLQTARRVVEIARNDYIATAARCNGARIGAGKFVGGDAIDDIAVEDVL